MPIEANTKTRPHPEFRYCLWTINRWTFIFGMWNTVEKRQIWKQPLALWRQHKTAHDGKTLGLLDPVKPSLRTHKWLWHTKPTQKICYHGNGVAMTTNQSIMTERIKRMSATWPVRERPKGKIDRIEPLMWQTFKLVHTRTTPCCRVATHWGGKWSRLSLNKVMHLYKVYFWLWAQMTGKNKHIFMEI